MHRLAVAQQCDVTAWDELVALFDLAMDAYGSVDVVVRPDDHYLFVI